ncbi:MAG: hypothetical protein ACR2MN_14225 [Acidimicrobiales bacterium]
MTLRTNSRHIRRARRAVIAASVVAGTLLAASPGIGVAAVNSYTWSGTDSAAGLNSNWSDPGNWAGNAAPGSGTNVDLEFPSIACGSPCQNTATNDLTGLKVGTLDLQLTTEGAGNADYAISGHGIKIGTLRITSATPTGLNGQGANINLPLALQGSEQWSIDAENGGNVNLGPVTGRMSNSLTVNLPVSNGTMAADSSACPRVGGWIE